MQKIPLCVDLDGTLIKNDTTKLACRLLIKRNFLYIVLFPIWLLLGLAYFKQQLAKRVTIDASTLPYNQEFLAWVKQQKAEGRSVILVSATDQKFADAVGHYLSLFDNVIASDGKTNLRSENKRDCLNKLYGYGQYDYAGNDYPDIAVWKATHKAIVVNAPKRLVEQCKQYSNLGKIFD